ncbi:MAG TPA: hypothetical protein VFY18_10685, partial [Candidatus Limnocylindrales bacterium]|nr:hypothetical protein [Candidatus Limnocylindrales bacterium]
MSTERDALRDLFDPARDIRPPAELGPRIKADAAALGQRHPARPRWLAGLAAAAAVAVVAVGIGLRSSAPPSTRPSGSPDAMAPSNEASPGLASRGPTGLGADKVARAIREIAMPTDLPVSVGQTVLIVGGPIEHDGVLSFLIQHFGDTDAGFRLEGDLAWMPATIAATSLVEAPPTCPTDLSLSNVAALQPFERMVCFGGRDLTFEPVTARDRSYGGKTSNRWISTDGQPDFFTGLPVYLTPKLAMPDTGWFRVTGHFDDPASFDCGDPGEVAWCRERFIVTAVVPVDPPEFVIPGTWRATKLPPIDGRIDHAMVWTGTEAVVWGGVSSSSEPGHSVFDGTLPRNGAAYDPAKDRWRIIPNAPIQGRSFPVMAWTGQEVVVFGGWVGETTRLDGAAWDPTSNAWRKIATSPLTGKEPIGAWLDDRLYVVTSNAAAAYDPATDRWTTLPAAPIRTGWQTAAVAAGRLFVIAFGDGATGSPQWAVLDPATGTWSHGDAPIDAMEAGIGFAGAGDLIVSTDHGATFDPLTGVWGSSGPCPGVSAGTVWTGGYLLGVTGAWRFDECWQLPPAPPREPPFDGSNGREFPVAVWTGRQYITW